MIKTGRLHRQFAALAEKLSAVPRTHLKYSILPVAPAMEDLTPSSGPFKHCTQVCVRIHPKLGRKDRRKDKRKDGRKDGRKERRKQ